MVKVLQEMFSENDGYYMDDNLKFNLDQIKEKVYKDWDMLFVVSGVEGGGKSTFTIQIAKYCDPTLDQSRICQSPEQFINVIKSGQKGQAIVLDEGFLINARSSMSGLNKLVLSVLSECRQRNLFLFIIIPSFFDLDKNLALWRSRGLFVIEADKLERGGFKFYNYDQKRYLWVKGKKTYDYRGAAWGFKGRFTKFLPIDESLYKKVKSEALTNRPVISKLEQRYRRHFLRLLHVVLSRELLTQVEISSITGILQPHLSEAWSEYKLKGDEANYEF